MNATLRENILFGKLDDDDEKFDGIVRACSLVQDLKMLPHGDRTEIGEKGINLRYVYFFYLYNVACIWVLINFIKRRTKSM